MKISMFRIPLKIHIWGGFGSQLYGINVAMKMQDIFPKRRIILVFHTSGVTRRKLEIPNFMIRNFIFSEVDDFVISAPSSQKSGVSFSKITFRNLAIYLGFLAELNSENTLLKIQPWLFQVRGHYSHLKIHPKIFSVFTNSLQMASIRPSDLCCTVHFRLGDLLHLKNKTYIDPKRVSQELDIRARTKEIVLLSDSNETHVRGIFGNDSSSFHFSFNNLSPLDTISYGVFSSIFIGTNSKISLWIAIFRHHFNIGESTSLPRELFSTLQFNCPTVENSSRFHQY